MMRFGKVLPMGAVFAIAFASLSAAAEPDIAESLRRHGFDRFSEAITRAGLTDTLKNSGTLTVFAPSESAFSAMPEEEKRLLFENKSDLSNFVLRHVVNGNLPEQGSTTVESMSGESLRLERTNDILTVNGVPVGGPAVTASNGLIHRIDTLLPPAETPVQ